MTKTFFLWVKSGWNHTPPVSKIWPIWRITEMAVEQKLIIPQRHYIHKTVEIGQGIRYMSIIWNFQRKKKIYKEIIAEKVEKIFEKFTILSYWKVQKGCKKIYILYICSLIVCECTCPFAIFYLISVRRYEFISDEKKGEILENFTFCVAEGAKNVRKENTLFHM